MNFKEALFIASHPIESIRAKIKQTMVAIDHELPPHTSTVEEFPELSIEEAVAVIQEAESSSQTSGWLFIDSRIIRKIKSDCGLNSIY